jgi:2,5-furandicarboxylate decarboxylase 1
MASDLRSYLAANADAVHRVRREVPLEYVGALTGQSDKTILFENLLGYPGWRLCDRLFHKRAAQARVLGTTPERVVPTLAALLERGPQPLREVRDGPVKEVRQLGEEADLTQLPVVTHTPIDPGPYTTSFNVLRDPETGVCNSMFPRTLVQSPRRGISSYVTRHSQVILEKYRRLGRPAPQAIVIGTHPALELAAAYSGLHDEFWELEMASTILGEPVEVVPCETIDLLVPAHAEVVIEGYVHPDEREYDGPSPGPALYSIPALQKQPVFEVTAITRRRDPIYRNHMVTPYTDHQPLPRLFHEAQLFRRLREMGLEVHDVFFPPWGGVLSLIIQISPKADGQVADALLAMMGSPWMNTKMVVAVDPDIDIYDPSDVYWALATRVDPARHVMVVPHTRGSPMDPSAVPVLEAGGETAESRFPSVVGKWGIDATKPVPYRPEREAYRRDFPMYWGEVNLADYLGPPEAGRAGGNGARAGAAKERGHQPAPRAGS